jgi:hypothetical protein
MLGQRTSCTFRTKHFLVVVELRLESAAVLAAALAVKIGHFVVANLIPFFFFQ